MTCPALIERVKTFNKACRAFRDAKAEENKVIGRMARAARIEAGVSVRKLSEKIGVSHTMVGAWENGSSFWTAEIAKRYAEGLK